MNAAISRDSSPCSTQTAATSKGFVRFNEYDISARQVATLTVKKDEPRILRIHNGSGTVSYALKIAKIE